MFVSYISTLYFSRSSTIYFLKKKKKKSHFKAFWRKIFFFWSKSKKFREQDKLHNNIIQYMKLPSSFPCHPFLIYFTRWQIEPFQMFERPGTWAKWHHVSKVSNLIYDTLRLIVGSFCPRFYLSCELAKLTDKSLVTKKTTTKKQVVLL